MIEHGKVSKTPMLISKLSEAPFSRISCGLVGPIIPASQSGYSYIVTIIDLATRYPDAIPLKRITTGKVADALKDFFSGWGSQTSLVWTMDLNFAPSKWKSFSKCSKLDTFVLRHTILFLKVVWKI